MNTTPSAMAGSVIQGAALTSLRAGSLLPALPIRSLRLRL